MRYAQRIYLPTYAAVAIVSALSNILSKFTFNLQVWKMQYQVKRSLLQWECAQLLQAIIILALLLVKLGRFKK